MLNKWKKFLLLSGAAIMVIIGLAGLILPIIPGVVLIIAGAVIIDRTYPQLRHHPRLAPQLKKIKDYLKSITKK